MNSLDDGRPGVDPGHLDRFVGELEELADELERIRARFVDLASLVGPGVEPRQRAADELAT